MIAIIEYYDSGEIVQYNSKEKFLSDFEENLQNRGIHSFAYTVFDDSLYSDVYSIICDFIDC